HLHGSPPDARAGRRDHGAGGRRRPGAVAVVGRPHDALPEVMALLKERGVDDVLVFGGGIIPEADIPKLKDMGVAAIFTPGSSMASITEWLREALEARES